MQTLAEENYLKAVYHLSVKGDSAGTNQLAVLLNTKASSVTDMLKKIADKKLINYVPYQGVTLTDEGEKIALSVIRKHRLWEHFLVEKLNFKWDEVHTMAEELEHISSAELIDRLDTFLGSPEFDPHGDPIPDCNGKYKKAAYRPLSLAGLNEQVTICAVANHTSSFLKYLEKQDLLIGKGFVIKEIYDFDGSMLVKTGSQTLLISREVADNLLIKND